MIVKELCVTIPSPYNVYRKIELYSMAWQQAVDLSKFIVSAASFGGPIGKWKCCDCYFLPYNKISNV